MSVVLVTGASGFLGGHLVPELVAAGHEVHALSRRDRPARPGVHWHRADVLDRDEVTGVLARVRPAMAVHLAWDVEPGRFWTSPTNLDWVGASLGLLRQLADVGCARVLLAGTCAEYDWSQGRCDERSTPLRPATLYGAAKLAVSSTALAAASVLATEIAVARIFFPFGPGEPGVKLVPSVAQALLRGQRAACSPGEQRRDFIYVADVARALALLLDSTVSGPVNVGTGHAVRAADLVQAVGEALGRPDLVGLGDRTADRGEVPLVEADVARLRAAIDLDLTPLSAAVARTARWWSAQVTASRRPESKT